MFFKRRIRIPIGIVKNGVKKQTTQSYQNMQKVEEVEVEVEVEVEKDKLLNIIVYFRNITLFTHINH